MSGNHPPGIDRQSEKTNRLRVAVNYPILHHNTDLLNFLEVTR